MAHADASPGEWGGSSPITFTYQWRRCPRTSMFGEGCIPIDGANAPVYEIVQLDLLQRLDVLVTGRNRHGSSSAGSLMTDPVSGVYTYPEAKALGYDVPPSSADTGLPPCDASGQIAGFLSFDDLEAAIAAAPDDATCTLDPTGTTTFVGTPAPGDSAPDANAAAKWFTGYTTINRNNSGVRAGIEIGDPDVIAGPNGARSAQREFMHGFVRVRSGAANSAVGPWLQVGWIESSKTSGRQHVIYENVPAGKTAESGDYSHTFFDRFSLVAGTLYAFRIRDCTGDSACIKQCGGALCSEIFMRPGPGRPQEWLKIFGTNSLACRSNCGALATIEVFSKTGREIAEGASGPPTTPPGPQPGVNFNNTQLLRSSGWTSWDATVQSGIVGPLGAYKLCTNASYTSWRAGLRLSGANCYP